MFNVLQPEHHAVFNVLQPEHQANKRFTLKFVTLSQALKLFRRHTGWQQFFQVHLQKLVPHGAHTFITASSSLALTCTYLPKRQAQLTWDGRLSA